MSENAAELMAETAEAIERDGIGAGAGHAIDIESSFVRFACADEMYAMKLTAIREVVTANPCSRVPRAPASTVGLMNHAGRVYTVVDLAALLRSAEGRARDHVLLLDDPARSLGIAVDSIEGIGPLEVQDDVGRLGDKAVSIIELQDLAQDIDAAFEAASVLNQR